MQPQTTSQIKLVPPVALGLSVAFFAACLFAGGYTTAIKPVDGGAVGWVLLLTGWMGVFYGYYAWLANPVLLLVWLLTLGRARPPALAASVLALALMLSFLLHDTMVANEAPTYTQILSYDLGYWLLVASGVLAVVANGAGLWLGRLERINPASGFQQSLPPKL